VNKRLPLIDLHERHLGITEALSESYLEAARVCLDKHHNSPVVFMIKAAAEESADVEWAVTDARTRGAWANQIDAVELGACGMALAAVELMQGVFAVRRAENRTGADYYVAPHDAPRDDLEMWSRLEISGTDAGDLATIRSRLREKINQTIAGNSNLPALAAVVGFKAKYIALAKVGGP
jgi:hypothetical protein